MFDYPNAGVIWCMLFYIENVLVINRKSFTLSKNSRSRKFYCGALLARTLKYHIYIICVYCVLAGVIVFSLHSFYFVWNSFYLYFLYSFGFVKYAIAIYFGQIFVNSFKTQTNAHTFKFNHTDLLQRIENILKCTSSLAPQ